MGNEEEYFYTKEHEWVYFDEGFAVVGIAEYAQNALGDVTYIELPSVGEDVEQFGQLASVESVKAASDIFSPLSGKIVEVNKDLDSRPELINRSCYEKGWIAKIEPIDENEKSNLMNIDEYRKFLEGLDS